MSKINKLYVHFNTKYVFLPHCNKMPYRAEAYITASSNFTVNSKIRAVVAAYGNQWWRNPSTFTITMCDRSHKYPYDRINNVITRWWEDHILASDEIYVPTINIKDMMIIDGMCIGEITSDIKQQIMIIHNCSINMLRNVKVGFIYNSRISNVENCQIGFIDNTDIEDMVSSTIGTKTSNCNILRSI